MARKNKKTPVLPKTQILNKQRRTPPGTVPGTLIADPDSPAPLFWVMQYGPEGYAERAEASLDEVMSCHGDFPITWINVEGLGDVEAIQRIGKAYHLHPLALEDVVNVHQRPKLDTYKDVLFLVARMPHPEAIPATEQVSFFLGNDFIITFQEGTPGDCFEPVRKRIREDSGRLRGATTAHLLYALLDTLVDQFFPQLEFYADLLQSIEDRIISHRHAPISTELYTIRRHLLMMHRIVRPLQDVIAALMREPLNVFDDETRFYLRDVYDHTTQLMDMLDTYKDLASHLMDMAASAAGARMNEIMRFLTVMSSIFIPLTFIAGVYGMNFKLENSPYNMPELAWEYGYIYSLFLMIAIAIGQMLFFKYKGWLGVPEGGKRVIGKRR
jgi:magnesium transporter